MFGIIWFTESNPSRKNYLMDPCLHAVRQSPALKKPTICLLLSIFLLIWVGITQSLIASHSEAGRPVSLGGSEGFKPRLGMYFYTARWEGSKAFEATVTVQKIDDVYRILVDSQTTGIIDFIFRVRYRGEGHLRAEDFAPVKSVLTEQKRKRSKETQINYLDDGGIEVVQTRTKQKKKPQTSSHTIQPETEVLEPFSAAFLARRFNWSEGETQQFEVITGNRTYLVTLVCQGQTLVAESGTKTKAWVIRPAVKNLSQPGKKSKITKTKLYVSADPHRELLKMRSETRAGTVILKMKNFVPQ